MRQPIIKANGDTLDASEWNQEPTQECANLVASTGQAFNSSNLYQVSNAVATYAANGNYYIDSGSVDHYVLSPVGLMQSPISYQTGMRIVFIPTNTNSGTCDITVNSLGVVPIKKAMGTLNLDAGDIAANTFVELVYNSAAGGWFELYTSSSFATISGVRNSSYILRAALETSSNNYNITDASIIPVNGTVLTFYVDVITGGASSGAITLGVNGTYYPVEVANNSGGVLLGAAEIIQSYRYNVIFSGSVWFLMNTIWSDANTFGRGTQLAYLRPQDVKNYVNSFIRGTAVYKTSGGFAQYSVSGVITSVAYVAEGYSQITFSPNLPNPNYGVIIFATEVLTSGGSDGSILARELSPTVSGFKVHTMAHLSDEAATDADCELITVLVI